jgi:hypothetical protein
LLPEVQVDVCVLVKDRRYSTVDITACWRGGGRAIITHCFSERAAVEYWKPWVFFYKFMEIISYYGYECCELKGFLIGDNLTTLDVI